MHTYESKQELATKLAEVLADLNVMATISHGFHWNVKGMDFSEYHEFFGEIYEDVDSSIDPTAENILKLGFDAPYLLQDFLSLTSVNVGRVRSSDPRTMLEQLAGINAQVIHCLYEAFNCANSCNMQGIANFLAERIDAHDKWQWQIAASLGVSVNDLLEGGSAPVEEMPAPAQTMDVPVMEEEVPVDVEATDEYGDLPDFSIEEN
jgi:starvation-inducible DNA-binding protein